MEQYFILLPGFIYLILGIAHFMNFKKRRHFVNKWIQHDKIQQVYFYYLYSEKRQDNTTKKTEKEINELLNRIAGHNFLSYWASFIITAIMVTFFTYMTLSHFVFIGPSIFEGLLSFNYPFFEFISNMQPPIYFASFGALVWGFFEFLQRYKNQNWSPVAQHMIWFKIPISMIVCYFIFNDNTGEVADIVAFGIGAFPVDYLRKFVLNAASSKLGSHQKNMLSSPRWESIRGITDQVIDKLEEYGVENVHQLASADPFRLHFNTNIELLAILDFIDQALLIEFINTDRAKIFQNNGITGAIDIAFIYNHDEEKHNKEELINSLADLLGFNKSDENDDGKPEFAIFKNMFSNIASDPRVILIKSLWDLNLN